MRPGCACPDTCSAAAALRHTTVFCTYAAKLVEADHYGVAVAMKNNIVTENALKDIAGKTKLVPETCDMLTVARRMGVSLG